MKVIVITQIHLQSGAALTIPSALALIIYLFPDPKAQAGAIGVFGGCGAVGNSKSNYIISTISNDIILVLGLVIGALLTQYASWRWCFYFVGIAAVPVAAIAFLLLPHGITTGNSPEDLRGIEKLLTVDLFGITLLTGK